MRVKGSTIISEIKLSEDNSVPNRVQVLRVGNFNHPKYGKFQITTATLAEMKKNFDERVRGIDTAFDYFHDSDKEASAWVKDLTLTEDGKELWALVDWTPAAAKKLAERELRYFSPDFAFQWQDPESGKKFSNVLFGGGLTNRPFVKEMAAIVAAEADLLTNSNKEGKIMTPEEIKAMCEELQKQIDELKSKLSGAEIEKETLMSEKAQMAEKLKCAEDAVKAAEDAKKLAEAEQEFNVMLTEGKACAAQKDAFIKGDMKEFIKLSQPLNTIQQGSGQQVDDKLDKEEKVLKLAEEKRAADKKLSVSESISLALKEIN